MNKMQYTSPDLERVKVENIPAILESSFGSNSEPIGNLDDDIVLE